MPDELLHLRDLIHERTGLFFHDLGLQFIETCLKPLAENSGCRSFAEYHRFLSQEENAGEWLKVFSGLSKPVSNLTRHNRRTGFLCGTVLPQICSDSDINKLRIWSAGCAAGEEPLAIALSLSESGWFDRLEIEIAASDANPMAIETARRGLYNEGRMGFLSPALRSKYFVREETGWRVKPELHKRIAFSVANLINENEIAALASSDIIFCRNVFIYFSEAAIVRTLSVFARHMPVGGYLFTDEGDYFTSLVLQIGVFERQEIPGASIWKKV
jgi:chemotaxis protein methyltransferase CheR